ncbi:DUF3157 family protein [Tamlana sp. 2201CG12-4]|uniref:DUF3157 family protein n=1 Tax=Tamlana sp. 2201CG12-4 TaxID=3112582 RepID=UPI002DBB4E25|nr:DUF3157 family protein [Tamlana sp. 2201CG12-4]MEC3906466.1 DUF3157 family protein [Tamlana sp. 2201CG12-4]
MKIYMLLLVFLISCAGLAQNNYLLKTEDGRRVLLKSDYTWEYVDMKPLIDSTEVDFTKQPKNSVCDLPQNFVEPKLDKKIQSQLKKGRATIAHIKKKVAKDHNCDAADVLLLSASEKKTNGVYHFCVNGTKVTYKRNGHAIVKKGKLF